MLVTDSSATLVVIGEVVGVYSTGTATETNVSGFFVLLNPTTVPFSPYPDPPAMVVVTGDTGKEIQSTEEEVFFGDTGCSGNSVLRKTVQTVCLLARLFFIMAAIHFGTCQ